MKFLTAVAKTQLLFTGLSLRGGGQGIPPAIMNVVPGRKIEPKEIPGCFIPCLLVVFTGQLES